MSGIATELLVLFVGAFLRPCLVSPTGAARGEAKNCTIAADSLDQSRFPGMCLPSPGLGEFGFGLGLG